jgi:hypothetical protein
LFGGGSKNGSRGGKAVKLFRSDFLNNHPVMLEYIAQGLLEKSEKTATKGARSGPGGMAILPEEGEEEDSDSEASGKRGSSGEEGGDGSDSSDDDAAARGVEGSAGGEGKTGSAPRRSFVERLRRATASIDAPADGAMSEGAETSPATSAEKKRKKKRRKDRLSYSPASTSSSPSAYDPSDPHSTIRRLVVVNEHLRKELEDLRKRHTDGVVYVGARGRLSTSSNGSGAGGKSRAEDDRPLPDESSSSLATSDGGTRNGDSDSDGGYSMDVAALRREVEILRVENNNMYLLRQENERMRLTETIAQMERAHSGSSPLSRRAKSAAGPGAQLPPSPPSNNHSNSKSTAHRLWDENSSLKSQLASAKALIGRLHAAVAQAQAQVAQLSASVSNSGGAGGKSNGRNQTSNSATLAAVAANSMLSEEDYLDAEDAEIAALIARNANNLCEIRRDLKEAENEMARSRREEPFSFVSAFPTDFTSTSTSSTLSKASAMGGRRRSGTKTPLARPSTAGARMRPAFNASVAMGMQPSNSSSSSNNVTSAARGSVSPGNLIGRSLESAEDVNDAKAAIRRAQLEMQRLRNARAKMEKEEEADAAAEAEEEETGTSAGSKSSSAETTNKKSSYSSHRVREVPPILDGTAQMQSRMVGSKQRLAGRLAGVPELGEDSAGSKNGGGGFASSPASGSGISPLLSRRSDTEESRVGDEERRQILFFNDGDEV